MEGEEYEEELEEDHHRSIVAIMQEEEGLLVEMVEAVTMLVVAMAAGAEAVPNPILPIPLSFDPLKKRKIGPRNDVISDWDERASLMYHPLQSKWQRMPLHPRQHFVDLTDLPPLLGSLAVPKQGICFVEYQE